MLKYVLIFMACVFTFGHAYTTREQSSNTAALGDDDNLVKIEKKILDNLLKVMSAGDDDDDQLALLQEENQLMMQDDDDDELALAEMDPPLIQDEGDASVQRRYVRISLRVWRIIRPFYNYMCRRWLNRRG